MIDTHWIKKSSNVTNSSLFPTHAIPSKFENPDLNPPVIGKCCKVVIDHGADVNKKDR
jgi:hypothetical protein